jgi:4-hydroxy-3-methylbut-2-enyl diphosphate reductase
LKQAYEGIFGHENLQHHFWSKSKNDTLCYATQVNQDALHQALQNTVDAAIVVGGKNSSNTFQLYRVCEGKYGIRAHYIQSEANILNLNEIRHYNFPYELAEVKRIHEEVRPFLSKDRAHQRILITGGASCPDGIIQQVISRINNFFPKEKLRPIEDLLSNFQA